MHLQDLTDLEAVRDHLLKHPEAFSELDPDDQRLDVLCEMVLRVDPTMLAHIPHQTPFMCRVAVQQNWQSFQFIKDVTLALFKVGLTENVSVQQFVDMRQSEFMMAVVEQDPWELPYLYDRTPEVCVTALRKAGGLLGAITNEEQTPEMCVVAVSNDAKALEFVGLPMDRLMEPESNQLQDWLTVVGACAGEVGGGILTLHRLIDRLVLGKQFRDDWRRPVDDHRCMLDLLADLSQQMLRLVHGDNRIERLATKVSRQCSFELQYEPEDGEMVPTQAPDLDATL